MARTSRADLDRKAEHLAKRTGLPINIQQAYGRCRVYIGDGNHISPRLPSGQLLDWMDAFEAGLDYAPSVGFFQERTRYTRSLALEGQSSGTSSLFMQVSLRRTAKQ